MKDRRGEILLQELNKTTDGSIAPFYNAMDQRAKEMCLDLLEYIAKNRIELDIVKGEVQCYWPNGEGITKEQLFENFL